MHSLHHLLTYVQRHGFKHRLLFIISSMIFFFAIADGILTYVLPLMIVEHGFTKTAMGIIIGSSSIAGAAFDLWLSKYLRKPHYRRMYLLVLLLTLLFAIILYGSKLLWIYILAMVVWGVYWDLFHFGNYDFVSRTLPEPEHAEGFGVMGVFLSLGGLIAPVMAGLVVAQGVTSMPFLLAGGMVVSAFSMYALTFLQKPSKYEREVHTRRKSPMSWLKEVHLWLVVGKQLLPLLILLLFFYVTDAFFWTIGPFIAESGVFGSLGGFLLVAYSLPVLFTGWFVGRITQRHGKKHTALIAFFCGSAIMSVLSLVSGPILTLAVVLCASFFLAFVLPSVSGAFADYISETKTYEKEIQSLSDFFYNIGWVVGPMLAGWLADTFGNTQSFTILGIIGVVVTLILLKITPKKIKIKVS